MRASLRSLLGLVLAGWLVLPFLPLVVWSFAHGWRFPDLLPADWSGKAWTYALSPASGVLESFALTTLIAAAATLLAALVGIPAGRALGLHRFRGRTLVTLLLLAPAILPGIAVVFGLHAKALDITPQQFQSVIEGMSHTRRSTTLIELANVAAFMASDRASAMTGTIVNLSMGSLDD